MRCDSHVHIVGEPARHPQAPNRRYTAAAAELGTLEALGARHGITRFVIVQPSFYLDDNTLLLESLDALGGRGRGIATIDPAQAPPARLAAWRARGVCGVRVNLYTPLMLGDGTVELATIFNATVAAVRAQGWHVEVIAPLPTLLRAADALAASPVPVVIDHYGLYGEAAPTGAEGRALLALLARKQVWIKLSAPYRVARDPMATRPDPAWLAAILEVAAERCVWGSDWPHTPAHELHAGGAIPLAYRRLRYEDVVDGFIAALPSPGLAEAILAANPARLYGFPNGA